MDATDDQRGIVARHRVVPEDWTGCSVLQSADEWGFLRDLAVSAVLALTASVEDLGELASAGAALSAKTAAIAATWRVMNGM